jgi:integral membrane sensor domain MASE1
MNPNTPMRFVLAAALIADAIVGGLLYRSAFDTSSGLQPLIGATVFALLVAGVAVAVVRKPSERALSLARASPW